MKISVIIPVYNEEKTIEQLMTFLEPLKDGCEIIFVDGGSTDKTLELIGNNFTVQVAEKGRANQMNAGAQASTGDVLFFLHCDSEPPKTMIEEIEQVMKKYRAGCRRISDLPAFRQSNHHRLCWNNHTPKIRLCQEKQVGDIRP